MFNGSTIEELIRELGYETAQYVIAIRAINGTTKAKKADLHGNGNFTKRVVKKASRIIPLSDEHIYKLLELAVELNFMESMQALNGLGGGEAKPVIYYINKYL